MALVRVQHACCSECRCGLRRCERAPGERAGARGYGASGTSADGATHGPGRHPHRVLFPHLRVLQIVRIDIAPDSRVESFRKPRHSVFELLVMCRVKGVKYGLDLVALAQCLRIRRGLGAFAMTIEFEDCHLKSMRQLEMLSGLGVDVLWNGRLVIAGSGLES